MASTAVMSSETSLITASDTTPALTHRNKPGTKRQDWCNWPDMQFDAMDSTLNVQQYIQQLIRKDPSNIDAILTPPDNQDEGVWKYEHIRVSIKESSVAKLGSVCRRVYRIFSHAYYHHRDIFDEFEEDTHLCKRFTVFVSNYNLMSREHLIVPIVEGLTVDASTASPSESEA